MQYIIVFIICLFGAIIQSVCGFGYAMIGISILAIVMPIKSVNLIILLSSFVLCVNLLLKFRNNINFRFILYPSLTIWLGTYIGIEILYYGHESFLKVCVGTFLVIISCYFIVIKKEFKVERYKLFGLFSGFISGIIVGLASIAGPLIAIYCMSVINKRETYIATLQGIFLLSGIYSILIHLYYGNFTINILQYGLVAVIAVMIGSMIGVRLIHKVNKEIFNKLIYLYILIMGTTIIITGILIK